ncbi:MAG: DUF1801 domain-containing protein [Burkholderiaceae bacterium]|jgi:hypothetical protein|nr:DUF1801 domain-containing protein [Burkholderiaceae bacterium]
MAEPKTKPTNVSVTGYLDALPDARVRADCRTLLALMSRASGAKPVLWGTSIVGFGAYRYTYASGTTGDWPLTGFAPRAKDITVYLMDGFDQRQAELARLGPHKHSKSCLYLKSLDAIDLRTLESMVADSVKVMRARWPAGSASATAVASQAAAKKTAVKKASSATKAAAAQKVSATSARATTAKVDTAQRVGANATRKVAGKSATKRTKERTTKRTTILATKAKSAAKPRARR